ncbi:MAG: 4-hydroxy-tetrahydrodipicolinate reductase [Syntrophomonadaceae bacterium]|nr:4-hydroxy-tetrahydrodipicolinate reductase [Syntrophomonadaceae bacterium]
MTAQPIRVIVAGALGRMGVETVKAIAADKELALAGLIDIRGGGESFFALTGIRGIELPVEPELETVLNNTPADVLVDFTLPQSVARNGKLALTHRLHTVIGATGLRPQELAELEALAEQQERTVAVIPNFALGAVMMMKLAREAARYFPDVEIIELHHDQKVDAPSGTALLTAEMIRQGSGEVAAAPARDFEKIAGVRGGEYQDLRIHSVRLPGLVAHQEVVFGGQGETLRIRHDSYDRTSFMPGVRLTIKKVVAMKGLIYGLDKLL